MTLKMARKATARDRQLLSLRGTPAHFAVASSNGRWKKARHNLAWNRLAMDLAARRERRLIIGAPPRHGKSWYWSQYFPAWHVGTYPDRRLILSSYEATFASSWGRRARDLIGEYGPSLFGVRLSESKQAADNWEIEGRAGGMLTAGIGGGITGRGADGLIIEDPVKNAEESLSATTREKHWDWFQSTASTRLEPDGWIVIIMTRWHPEDLAGRVLMEQPGQWRVINYPALALDNDPLGRVPGETLWPERWPQTEMEKRRGELDPYWWNALYQQQPSRSGRFEWPDEYFQGIWVPDAEWPTSFDARFMAGDASMGKEAKGGDYQAIVSIGIKDGLVWVDSDIRRRPTSEFCEAFVRMARRTKTMDASLEINQFQELLEPEIARIVQRDKGMPLPLRKVHNAVKKELRIRRLGPYFARKEFRFRDTPDNRLGINMAREFSFGDYDDFLDALEMAIRGGIEYLGGHVDESDLGNNLLEAA